MPVHSTHRPLPSSSRAGSAGTPETYSAGNHSHPVGRCIVFPNHAVNDTDTITMSSVYTLTTTLYLYGLYLPGPHIAKSATIYLKTEGNAGDVLKLALFDADGWRVLDWGSLALEDVGAAPRTVNSDLATPREISPGFYWMGTMCNVTNSPAVLAAHPRITGRLGGRITGLGDNTMPKRFDASSRTFFGIQEERPYVSFSEL